MMPRPYRVVSRHTETADTVTLRLSPIAGAAPEYRPGQFGMLYAYGVGDVPISVSECRADGDPVHTIRAVGAVTRALCAAVPGTVIGASGPYGTGWDLTACQDRDVVIVAGGIGLAPLRPVVHQILAERARYGRVSVIAGARSAADLIYRQELRAWRRHHSITVRVTVDHWTPGWTGAVGFVTEPLERLDIDPARTTVMLCGPEVMMTHCARRLLARGLAPEHIAVSLERDMRCGTGICGHCQLGPMIICRDGPVCDYERAEPLLAVREL